MYEWTENVSIPSLKAQKGKKHLASEGEEQLRMAKWIKRHHSPRNVTIRQRE